MPSEWSCSTCTYRNAASSTACDICFSQRKSHRPSHAAETSGPSAEPDNQQQPQPQQQCIGSGREVGADANVSLSLGKFADGLHILPDSPPAPPPQQQSERGSEQRASAFISSLSRNDTIVLLSDSDESKHEVEPQSTWSSDPIVVELSDTEEEKEKEDLFRSSFSLGKRKASSKLQGRCKRSSGSSLASSAVGEGGPMRRCGSIAASTSAPSRSRSTQAVNAEERALSQLEKALEKERLKVAKDREKREARQRRLREREEQEAKKKKENEVNQLNKQKLMGKYKFDEIVVGFDISSMQAANSDRLCEKLKERGIVTRTLSGGVRNSICFSRLLVQEALERDCFQDNRLIPQHSSSFKEVQLGTLILRYLPGEFQDLVRSDSLLSTIEEILSKKDNERLILIVEGLERHIAAEQSKRLRNRVRGNAGAGSDGGADDRALQNRPDIDDLVADVIFRFTGRCCIQLTKDAEESSEYIAKLAEVTAKSWYKRDSSVLLFTKQKKTAPKARLYPGSKEWFNYLLSIDQMSENRAEQMVKKYPNFASLMEAYRGCGSDDARRVMLQDLQRDERRFGPKFSQEVFNRIYSM